jgi:hypothetical protein
MKVIGGKIREEKNIFVLKNRGEKITKLKMKNHKTSYFWGCFSSSFGPDIIA